MSTQAQQTHLGGIEGGRQKPIKARFDELQSVVRAWQQEGRRVTVPLIPDAYFDGLTGIGGEGLLHVCGYSQVEKHNHQEQSLGFVTQQLHVDTHAPDCNKRAMILGL